MLTAAQCSLLQKQNTIKAPVRLGEWDVTTDPDCEKSKNGQKYCADPHVDFGIEEFILHQNFTYKKSHSTNDIALIRLDRYVNFTEFIVPVCLPIQPRLRSKMYDGLRMISIGFGKTASSYYAAKKQSVSMPGVSVCTCSNKTRLHILDSQLCAGGIGTGNCLGDSGGPLIYEQSVDFRKVYVLVGIASISSGDCNHHGGVSVFTKVGAFMDWIQKNLKP